jgi:hypothetical protein
MHDPIINKPRYKPQGRNVRFHRSKALAKRRLLTAIRDFQAGRDQPERRSECAANTESQTHEQGGSS